MSDSHLPSATVQLCDNGNTFYFILYVVGWNFERNWWSGCRIMKIRNIFQCSVIFLSYACITWGLASINWWPNFMTMHPRVLQTFHASWWRCAAPSKSETSSVRPAALRGQTGSLCADVPADGGKDIWTGCADGWPWRANNQRVKPLISLTRNQSARTNWSVTPFSIKWPPEHCLPSMAPDHSPSHEDAVGMLYFKSP